MATRVMSFFVGMEGKGVELDRRLIFDHLMPRKTRHTRSIQGGGLVKSGRWWLTVITPSSVTTHALDMWVGVESLESNGGRVVREKMTEIVK